MALQLSCVSLGYQFSVFTKLGDNRQRSGPEFFALCEAEAARRGVPQSDESKRRGVRRGGRSGGGHGVATTPTALAQQQAPITLAQENAMEARQVLAANRTASFGWPSFGGIIGGIGRAVGGLIPGAGIITTAIDTITRLGRPADPVVTPVITSRPVSSGPGTSVATVGCPSGLIKVGGRCVDILAALPGGRPFTQPVLQPAPGTAIQPRGAQAAEPRGGMMRMRMAGGFAPVMVQSVRSDCGPQHVLGADGLCYPKRGFPNRDRMWPKGRAPLLTGGERNAITKASRAAKKIERTTKQLQRLGMIKKPQSRRAAPRSARAPLEISPGATRIINVD